MYNTLAVVFFACKEKYFFFAREKNMCKKNSHITKLPNEPIPQETI